MKLLAFDTETMLSSPGCQAPPLVCIQFCIDDAEPQLIHVRDPACRRRVEEFLTGDYLWSSHTGSYDMAVLSAQYADLVPAIFDAYRSNRITCTETRHRLIHIAQGTFKSYDKKKGSFSLDGAAKFLRLDIPLDKTSRYRTRYGELYQYDIDYWRIHHPDAVTYALGDALAQRAVHRAQDAYALENGLPLTDQFAKAYDSFWTYLCTCWGLRTDLVQVEKYLAEVKADLERAKVSILQAGLLRPNGTKDMKKAQAHMVKCCADLGIDAPTTDKGGIALDADSVEQFGDALLEDYQAFGSASTRIKRVEDLRHGSVTPIQPGYKALGADTGRMSCIGNNSDKAEFISAWRSQAQNPPRALGYRESFIPRAGNLMWSVDWTGIEPRVWAGDCIRLFGRSRMAEELNQGEDPYIGMAADISGIPEALAKEHYAGKHGKELKDAMKRWRTMSKPIVLGAPAGMGGAKIAITARKQYGVIMTAEEAKKYLNLMKRRYPELPQWLDWASRMLRGKETCTYVYPDSGRMRGGLWYTALANGAFQGRARDIFGEAGGQVSYECYVDKSSVLYGSRITIPLHDELLGESREDIAHLCAQRVSDIMCAVARKWVPTLAASFQAPPALMYRWSKLAEPAFDASSRLIPWQP